MAKWILLHVLAQGVQHEVIGAVYLKQQAMARFRMQA
jgi:hypothetical protein